MFGSTKYIEYKRAIVFGSTLEMVSVTNGTNATPPASKDGVFNCSEQLRVTVYSGAPSRMASEEFHYPLSVGVARNG